MRNYKNKIEKTNFDKATFYNQAKYQRMSVKVMNYVTDVKLTLC